MLEEREEEEVIDEEAKAREEEEIEEIGKKFVRGNKVAGAVGLLKLLTKRKIEDKRIRRIRRLLVVLVALSLVVVMLVNMLWLTLVAAAYYAIRRREEGSDCNCGCVERYYEIMGKEGGVKYEESVKKPNLMVGDTRAEKVWNYLVLMEVPGVSDNAAVIAGIMGNLMAESSLNPSARSGGAGTFHGLYQTSRGSDPELLSTLEAIPGWTWNNNAMSKEMEDEGIRVTLEYLVNKETDWKYFGDNLEIVENKTGVEGARAYAELFVVGVERAVAASGPDKDMVKDKGILQYIETVLYPGSREFMKGMYQHTERRRKYAEDFYKEFVDKGISVEDVGESSTMVVEGIESIEKEVRYMGIHDLGVEEIGEELGKVFTGGVKVEQPSSVVDMVNQVSTWYEEGSVEEEEGDVIILDTGVVGDISEVESLFIATNTAGNHYVLVAPYYVQTANMEKAVQAGKLRNEMERYADENGNVTLADWYGYVESNTEALDWDSGYKPSDLSEYVEYIVGTVGKGIGRGSLTVEEEKEIKEGEVEYIICDCPRTSSCWEIIGDYPYIITTEEAKALGVVGGGETYGTEEGIKRYSEEGALLMVEIGLGEQTVILGDNAGGFKYKEWFYGTSKYNGVAWCTSFVSWVADQAGFAVPGATAYNEPGPVMPRFHNTNEGIKLFKEMGRYIDIAEEPDYIPKPGDIVFFDWGKGRESADHVAIVVEVDSNGKLVTVEGNTSGANGGNGGNTTSHVAKKNRGKTNGSTVMGYGIPKYPEPGKGITVE